MKDSNRGAKKVNGEKKTEGKRQISRREFVAVTTAAGAAILGGVIPAIAEEKIMKKTFTILHTNDMHSAFIGMGPAADYSPFTLNDDATRGGYARLASIIAQRRKARSIDGPVLTLDAGDFSMGTAFAAATRETGGELQIMHRMGYDATTFGNHEFDLGADGLAKAISIAAKAKRIPAVVAANTDFSGSDAVLAEAKRLTKDGVIRPYTVLERGGIKFGIFGVLGKEAQIYTMDKAVKYTDAFEAAKETVKALREKEKVDIVICLSHGGVEKDKDGKYTDGDDIRLPKAVPGIDIVIGGHSHTKLEEPIIVNGRTPVVQTGLEGRNLGELVISIDGAELTVKSYRLYPVDDSVAGDRAIQAEIDSLKPTVNAAVFASRGYAIDQPLAIAPRDLSNKFTDIAGGTLLANLCTDAFRKATNADVGFTANGMMRAPLSRGKSGVLTVYDVFSVAPLGAGVLDTTPGSTLVTGWFTGQELKYLLEFFLIDNAAHPGEYFPRTSGLRFRFDKTRPMFDVVTAIELGDLDHGYQAIDISGKDQKIYSLTCPLMIGVILAAIPTYTKGKLPLVPKNSKGERLKSKVDALEMPRENSGFLLAPPGNLDEGSLAKGPGDGNSREIKEWQAIMDYLRNLPAKNGELPVIPVDERANEIRAIRTN
jgi:5'-nucleotidase/UDP-sugar diphosphatase